MAPDSLRKFIHNREQPLSVLFFFVYGLAVLYYFNTSSPKLDFNPCPSPNMYLTIGQAMFDGFVPYRDLFDGKGMPIFLFNGIGGLIDSDGYIGQWLVSCAFFAWTLYYINRTARLFLNRTHALAGTLLMSFFILFQRRMYLTGAMGDEFTMPMIAMGIYYFLILGKDTCSFKKLCIFGCLGGLLLACKFTLASFWFVLVFAVLAEAWRHLGFRAACKRAGMIAIGAAFILIPCIAYFAWHGALDAYVEGYIVFHTYHVTESTSNRIFYLVRGVMDYPDYILLILAGMAYWIAAASRGYSRFRRIGLPVSFIAMYLAVFAGSMFSAYYLLSLIPFATFGIIYLLHDMGDRTLPFLRRTAATGCCIAFLFLLSREASSLITDRGKTPDFSLETLKRQKQELADLAQAISQESAHPTVLCFGCFDNGIYRRLGIIPNVPRYQLVNFDPQGKTLQRQYVSEHRCEFILVNLSDVKQEEMPSIDAFLRECGYRPLFADNLRSAPWLVYKRTPGSSANTIDIQTP